MFYSESILKEQIGNTIKGITFRLSPKTPKNQENFFDKEFKDSSINDFNVLNNSFQFETISEIVSENNDLKSYLTKVKSKFEMLLNECKEIETKLSNSTKENEELRNVICDIKGKEVRIKNHEEKINK